MCVQLEHEAALANIDAILAVEGIDVFFIGPSDLSQSMGYPGNPKAPPVAEAIEQALARIVAAGRTPGMPATAETLDEVLGRGCRYVYTHLPRLLSMGAAAFSAAPSLRLWPKRRRRACQTILTRCPAILSMVRPPDRIGGKNKTKKP